ncbi:hypothetical protein OF83DRAFT_1135911 [Amylostereum chailletii]|nr:hypothetical protein OF83DRAFT_1135911 [Amylostereum chailletii]
MSGVRDDYEPYSWHQSHDQATILLILPYGVLDEEVQVTIERTYLVAGVRGQPPLIKGRLYGNVDIVHSEWQLEPNTTQLSRRDRTISTTSTASASTQSSYALVSSDPDISSSFAASLASGATSDAEDLTLPSPSHSSPVSSADERTGYATVQRRRRRTHLSSRGVSPGNASLSFASSLSSRESLHSTRQGRLLTLHLEKADSIIWPSLIVGPVSPILSACSIGPSSPSDPKEQTYDMDPTSLTLVAFELSDIRNDKVGSFEYFLRAWLRAHVPAAAMRLVTHYVPLHAVPSDVPDNERVRAPGSVSYYVHMLGGASGLAQLYLEAGLLHLEGSATVLLSSSYSPLSSIRLPSQPPPMSAPTSGTDSWRRDRAVACKYFERARSLSPELDVPLLVPEGDDTSDPEPIELEMPSIDVRTEEEKPPAGSRPRRRFRTKEDDEKLSLPKTTTAEGVDDTWYLYIPGLIGAGTALLVVGVVGAIGFSSWRRNQS